MKPIASIIIPCYNNEVHVAQAIESALAQSLKNIEVIVIDDGSTDNSTAIIDSYKHLILINKTENQGACAARNLGLKLSSGRYIKFLDADDYLVPDCLERQVTQINQYGNDTPLLVFGDASWVDEAGDIHSYSPAPPMFAPGTVVDFEWVIMNAPLTSCPLHKRDDLLNVGGFDIRVPRGQEYDLHMRLFLAGVSFIYYPGTCYYYREHETPARISNRNDGNIATARYETLNRHLQLAVKSMNGKLSPPVKQAFARNYWRIGRGVLRNGSPELAVLFFDQAKKICPEDPMEGSNIYRFVNGLFGPRFAEAISQAYNWCLK